MPTRAPFSPPSRRSCSKGRCRPAPRLRPRFGRRWPESSRRSPACRPRCERSSTNSSRCSPSPRRAASGRVSLPWPEAARDDRDVPRELALEPISRCFVPPMERCIRSSSARGTAIRRLARDRLSRARRWRGKLDDDRSSAPGEAPTVSAGLASGWKIVDASTLARTSFEADVAIVGTGAGGGTAAEILAETGLSVIMIEEGPLATSSDFRMREAEAYPQLYQESAARKTRDKAINILQGRCVGGGTTVNWTSSFRTPVATLEYWAERVRFRGIRSRRSRPVVRAHGARLNVAAWPVPPNDNNDVLAPRRPRSGSGRRRSAATSRVAGTSATAVSAARSRQAVHAGDDDPGRARARCDTHHARPRSGVRPCEGTRRQLDCVALDARGTDPTPRRITSSAQGLSSRPAARSARPRSCCAAMSPIRTTLSANARFCIRRWFRPR